MADTARMMDMRWQSCEWCASNQIEGGAIDIEGTEAMQWLDCLVCGAQWLETYVASNRQMLEPGDPDMKVTAWVPGKQD